MRKLNKVLLDKGILYEADEWDIMRGAEYDISRQLVEITKDFIITVMYSAVLDPIFYLYDRKTLELIGEQNVFPEPKIWGAGNTWGSYCWTGEEC